MKQLFGGFEKDERELNLEDDKGKYFKGRELNKWGAGSRREDAPGMWFPIDGPNGEDVYPIRNDGSEGRWRLGKEKMRKRVADGDVIFEKRNNGTYIVYEKVRETKSGVKQLTTLFLEKYINAKGTEELKKIFSTSRAVFDYAKPTELIKDLIILANANDDSIVLDFFVGSGTTGQAVLQLNKEDGGQRKFILVTNNEVTSLNPNGIANDVTSKRLKRVMTGKCYDGTNDFKWLDDNEPFGGNLDVYKIKTVANFEATKDKTPFDVIDETLYGKEKLSVNDKIKWVCENFDGTQSVIENDNEYENRIRGEE